MVADGAAQGRVALLESIEDRSLRDLTHDLEMKETVHASQRLKMGRKLDVDQGSGRMSEGDFWIPHNSVWTSTESTGGRSRTIGSQLSPASGEA